MGKRAAQNTEGWEVGRGVGGGGGGGYMLSETDH